MAGVVSAVTAIVFPQYALPIGVACASLEAFKALRKKGSEESEIKEVPAAEVSGKVSPVTLKWKNLSYKAESRKKGSVHILKECTGEAKPGHLLALMGPSGAGKTSLINVLASQVPKSTKVEIRGQLTCNAHQKTVDHPQAYVPQSPNFFSCLTVRETLQFAARARLPSSVTTEDREEMVEDLILKLGLAKCADSFVGNATTQGISGGEKKRLSIASEMIGTPALIFVDEPTSGLDSFQAEQVIDALRVLAKEGHTVICSIHQPRGSIYNMFDDLCLLSEGETLFCGPVDGVLGHFSELGLTSPSGTNPAEFLADVISIDYSDPVRSAECRDRISSLSNAYREKIAPTITIMLDPSDYPSKHVGHPLLSWWDQLSMLFGRSVRQVKRDRKSNMARIIPSITSAIMFGMIYWRMGRDQSGIHNRLGFLMVCATNTAMLAMTRTLKVFPPEKSVVDRERARHSYHVLPYLLGKIVAELPAVLAPPLLFGSILYPMAGLEGSIGRFARFLSVLAVEGMASGAIGLAIGSLAPTAEIALSVGPSIMLIFILFGGYYVTDNTVPFVLRWIPRVSVIRWSYKTLAVNQFQGIEFTTEGPTDTATGEQVIQRLGSADESYASGLVELVRITSFFYVLSYWILNKRKRAFQDLLEDDDVGAVNLKLNNGQVEELEKVAEVGDVDASENVSPPADVEYSA
ncbi:hypothetical protein NDN08_001736 [Rhodosorus marinus]|uniref:Probable ATP-dependent transporter ycf16 n=1 Tax=Rhodosorus marinus TaxID=101924 RepID=A0AAV8UVU1_9RHOD|nr:hypothetical protein NDN08_001736 [Rhodosorus marinus]